MKNVTVLIHGVENTIIGVFNTREKAIRTGIKLIKHAAKERGEENITPQVTEDEIRYENSDDDFFEPLVIKIEKYHLNRSYVDLV